MNLEEVDPFSLTWAAKYVSPGSKFVACLSDPCQNGGIRKKAEGDLQSCRCPKHYAGKYCQYCSFYLAHQPTMKRGLLKYSNDRTRFKLKTRGSGLFLAFHGNPMLEHMIIFQICIQHASVMSVILAEQRTEQYGLSIFAKDHTVLSPHHCRPSEYDSFWIDNSEGTFRMGNQGDSTPFVKFRPTEQVKITGIALRVESPPPGADWMVELPCGRRFTKV
ncbi:uncharacterized protein LOC121410824 [Lytechinus variegatus]|uniref:uncharacterized protein LOC121410824 n=1 Tax=Lytechinus variegatus TaxID=7654 RepID=UPI001BB18A29|nr:uncharacterized protein LOC121410824 [Lytechinus variegatus]